MAAAVLLTAAPAAEAKTLLRKVGIAVANIPGSGYDEYKVVLGRDGVFRGASHLKVPIRIGGKINNSGNAHKIFNAYILGSGGGKIAVSTMGTIPNNAYKLLRSATKDIAGGPYKANFSKGTLGSFATKAERLCKDRRSGGLLPLKLTLVVEAGKHAALHSQSSFVLDQVRTLAATTTNIRIRCVASHGPKTKTSTKAGGKPRGRTSTR
jgi:hypothetical protein